MLRAHEGLSTMSQQNAAKNFKKYFVLATGTHKCSFTVLWPIAWMPSPLVSVPPKGGRGFMMSPSWNLRAFSLIPRFYISLLFFCLVLLLPLSYPLLVHSSDFFFPKPPFSERWALGVVFLAVRRLVF